jgi:hypothetical protein
MPTSSLNGGSAFGSTLRQRYSQLIEFPTCRNSVDWIEVTQQVLQQITNSCKRGSVSTDSIKCTVALCMPLRHSVKYLRPVVILKLGTRRR